MKTSLGKTLEIMVSPTGETKIQTCGFVGRSCRDASQFIEQALGPVVGETLTAEFHEAATESVVQSQTA